MKTRIILCVLVGLVSAGCATTSRTPETRPEVQAPIDARQSVRIFRGGGQPATWEDVARETARADAVLLGETHGHPVGLGAAAILWEEVLASADRPALLLEFFERDAQLALDDHLSGVTDAEQFRAAARRTDGNYPEGHSRMVEAARRAGAPVIAANAPRRYVRLARTDGYDRLRQLGPKQQETFEIPTEPIEGRYRDEFFGLMSGMAGHGAPGEDPQAAVEAMFRSQSVWDATMADSVADALRVGAQPAVLVIGRFHIDFGGGTVQMLRRERPDVRVVTVTFVAEEHDSLAEEDVGRADFVFYTGPAE